MLIITNKQIQAFDDYLLREFAKKTTQIIIQKLSLEREPDDIFFVSEVLEIIKKAIKEYYIKSKSGLGEFVFFYFTFPQLQEADKYPSIIGLIRDQNLSEQLKLEQLFFRLKYNNAS